MLKIRKYLNPKCKKKVFLFCIFLCFISCTNHHKAKTIRLGHGLDTQHPVHKAMVYFGQRLQERSNGQLKLQIYPSAQLGGERECLELLQIGSLDITKVSAAVLENFIPEYKVFSIPYLFRNKKHLFSVLDGDIGEQLKTQGEQFRLRGLTFYDAGSRSFYTKEKPIENPSDLKGLKIRVMKSNMAIAMVNTLGGAATPISYGELYTALQQGVVDGAENNPPSFYTSKHYEVCKYYSIDEHTVIPDVLVIGLGTWQRLNAQERKWVQEASNDSTIYERKLWEESEQFSLAEVKKAGVKIIYPKKSSFENQTKSILESFKNEPKLMSLIHSIKAKN